MSANAKLLIPKKKKCERILIGTSRIEFAFNPEDSHWSNMPTCNLGISGSNLADQIAILQSSLDQSDVKEVIWAFDFLSFTYGFPSRIIKAGLAEMISWGVTKESLNVIKSSNLKHTNGYTESGYLKWPQFKAMSITRFRNDYKSFISENGLLLQKKIDSRYYDHLTKVANSLRSKNIKFSAVILPVHALHLEYIKKAGLKPSYDKWVVSLIRVTGGILDFSNYDFPNNEHINKMSSLKWYWDTHHVTALYGSIIIYDINSASPKFGTFYNSETDYLSAEERREEGRLRWLNQNSESLVNLGLI